MKYGQSQAAVAKSLTVFSYCCFLKGKIVLIPPFSLLRFLCAH